MKPSIATFPDALMSQQFDQKPDSNPKDYVGPPLETLPSDLRPPIERTVKVLRGNGWIVEFTPMQVEEDALIFAGSGRRSFVGSKSFFVEYNWRENYYRNPAYRISFKGATPEASVERLSELERVSGLNDLFGFIVAAEPEPHPVIYRRDGISISDRRLSDRAPAATRQRAQTSFPARSVMGPMPRLRADLAEFV